MRYRYRVEKKIGERTISFVIELRAGSDAAATLMAGAIGVTLGLMLIGPL